MSLKQINKQTYTSSTNSGTITGVSSNNPHMLVGHSLNNIDNAGVMDFKFTVSGSATSASTYDIAYIDLKGHESFQKFGNPNQDMFRLTDDMGHAGNVGNSLNFVITAFNMQSTDEYVFANYEITSNQNNTSKPLRGYQGAVVVTDSVSTQYDGFSFNLNGTNGLGSGTLTLYEILP